jgi:hypothetical protein
MEKWRTPYSAEVPAASCWSRAIGADRTIMSNPWAKKNPFMSMWLTAANSAAGRARGLATSAAKRQLAAAQADATGQVLDFWFGKPKKQASRRKPRR